MGKAGVVARYVVTLGASIERGAVQAVALTDAGARLPQRVLAHTVVPAGTTPAELAAAVSAALDAVAAAVAETGPDADAIAGAAVVYREPAQRRAVVSELADGPWHGASLVSATSAHLRVAAAMAWLAEFDDLLVCDVVPGYQAFTLVDAARSRVLAAVSRQGSPATLAEAVRAARDQIEAAGARPDAVVLVGSTADDSAVRAAADGFGAPVLPCPIAPEATAVGAALWVMDDVVGLADTSRPARGRPAPAVLTAAGALACGLVTAGVYVSSGMWTGVPAVTDDARVTAGGQAFAPPRPGGPGGGATLAPGASAPEGGPAGPVAGEHRAPSFRPSPAAAVDTEVELFGYGKPLGRWGEQAPLPLQPAEATPAQDLPSGPVPGTGVPTRPAIGNPDATLMFPGEAPPPAPFTPEFYDWWDNHIRLIARWATQQFLGA